MGTICGTMCLPRIKRPKSQPQNDSSLSLNSQQSFGHSREIQIALSPTHLENPLLESYENQPIPVEFVQGKKTKPVAVEKKLKKVSKPSRLHKPSLPTPIPLYTQTPPAIQSHADVMTGDSKDCVVLLGCNEAGKSTLLQQISNLSSPAPSLVLNPTEQANVKRLIICTMVADMQRTVEWMQHNKLKPSNAIPTFYLGYLMNYQAGFVRDHVPFVANRIPFEIKNTLESLWADPVVKESFIRCNRHHSATWRYFEQLGKIAHEEWIPTMEDTLLCKHHSHDVEQVFYSGMMFCDIGGTRSCPDSWASCFYHSGFVIFMVSVISTQLTFKQSLGLFRTLCASEWFRELPILILFTKADLFDAAYCEQLLLDCYGSGSHAGPGGSSVSSVMKAIEEVFIQAERECPTSNRAIYTYWISLISTKQVRTVVDQIVNKLRNRK